jgi:3-isopropylmalate/(R)-2-methylmalate dehydratase small subunit
LSSRFADIFRGNSGKAGLLTAQVEQSVIEQLWGIIEKDPTTQVTVDLNSKKVSAAGLVADFQIDDYVRWRLLEGLDDVALTLQKVDSIDSFESARASFLPVTQG